MAKGRYEALSPEARKIIDDQSGEAESRALGKAWDDVEEEARQAAKKDPKHTVVTPSAELTAKWQAAVAPVTDAWTKATPGGDKLPAAFRETLAKVKAGQ